MRFVMLLSGLVLCIALSSGAIGQEQVQAERCAQYDREGKCLGISASLINLIATPERFHGKTVQVVGYLALEFEHTVVYLNRDSTADEALWVSFGEGPIETEADADRWESLFKMRQCKFNHQRVKLRGTFNMKPAGHMEPSYPGSIRVKHVELLAGREKPCKRANATLQGTPPKRRP